MRLSIPVALLAWARPAQATDAPGLFAIPGLLIVVVALGVIWLALLARQRLRVKREWVNEATPQEVAEEAGAQPSPGELRAQLADLGDDAFSLVLFEEYLYRLYRRRFEASGRRANVHPYFTHDLAREIESTTEGSDLLLGGMQVGAVTADRGVLRTTVRFRSAVTETTVSGKPARWYRRETWDLFRKRSARSRGPERTELDQCPACGEALPETDISCTACRKRLEPGQFDWGVASIQVERRKKPFLLGGEATEVGTDLPTVVTPGAEARYAKLLARDPNFSGPAFQQRLELVFSRVHDARTAHAPDEAAAVSRGPMLDMQRYRIDCEQRAGLRTTCHELRIVSTKLAEVVSDQFFDSITVRVLACGLYYTCNDQGDVVAGSRDEERTFSEYWTLSRDKQSPDARWLLSRLEQDEVYRA